MEVLRKLFGISAHPAKVEVIQQPGRFSRTRAMGRKERIEISLKKLKARSDEPKVEHKIARLEAELKYLNEQLGS